MLVVVCPPRPGEPGVSSVFRVVSFYSRLFACNAHLYFDSILSVFGTVNAQIHPSVASFFNLGRERIILRYCHLHPAVSEEFLGEILNYRPKHFHWAGSDLFTVTNAHGTRQSIIIETNSCPSGQKSMPLLQDTDEYGGYRKVCNTCFGAAVSIDVNRSSINLSAHKRPCQKNGVVSP